MENKITRKADLSLQEFCDMDQLYRLLDNWSKSSGMATMIVDKYGNQVSEDFGMTEFCRMVQSCETGKACCMATWKSDLDGIYECPFGFWDFSIPIVLPDGQALGKVLAGQALSTTQRDEAILHFNKNMMDDNNGEVPTDIAKINAAISREGWADGTGLVNVDGMPHCPKCGYINRKTKLCVNCGAKLKF